MSGEDFEPTTAPRSKLITAYAELAAKQKMYKEIASGKMDTLRADVSKLTKERKKLIQADTAKAMKLAAFRTQARDMINRLKADCAKAGADLAAAKAEMSRALAAQAKEHAAAIVKLKARHAKALKEAGIDVAEVDEDGAEAEDTGPMVDDKEAGSGNITAADALKEELASVRQECADLRARLEAAEKKTERALEEGPSPGRKSGNAGSANGPAAPNDRDEDGGNAANAPPPPLSNGQAAAASKSTQGEDDVTEADTDTASDSVDDNDDDDDDDGDDDDDKSAAAAAPTIKSKPAGGEGIGWATARAKLLPTAKVVAAFRARAGRDPTPLELEMLNRKITQATTGEAGANLRKARTEVDKANEMRQAAMAVTSQYEERLKKSKEQRARLQAISAGLQQEVDAAKQALAGRTKECAEERRLREQTAVLLRGQLEAEKKKAESERKKAKTYVEALLKENTEIRAASDKVAAERTRVHAQLAVEVGAKAETAAQLDKARKEVVRLKKEHASQVAKAAEDDKQSERIAAETRKRLAAKSETMKLAKKLDKVRKQLLGANSTTCSTLELELVPRAKEYAVRVQQIAYLMQEVLPPEVVETLLQDRTGELELDEVVEGSFVVEAVAMDSGTAAAAATALSSSTTSTSTLGARLEAKEKKKKKTKKKRRESRKRSVGDWWEIIDRETLQVSAELDHLSLLTVRVLQMVQEQASAQGGGTAMPMGSKAKRVLAQLISGCFQAAPAAQQRLTRKLSDTGYSRVHKLGSAVEPLDDDDEVVGISMATATATARAIPPRF